jgi:hypothetical protein
MVKMLTLLCKLEHDCNCTRIVLLASICVFAGWWCRFLGRCSVHALFSCCRCLSFARCEMSDGALLLCPWSFHAVG